MDSDTISAIASLLWPVSFLFVLVIMYRPVSRMINGIANRGGTIKIGEFELSLPDVAQQQQVSISDLQAEVAELNTRMKEVFDAQSLAVNSHAQAQPQPESQSSRGTRIMWVDDHPENNGSLQSALTDQGYSIENALSTADALALFAPNKYDFVVSDMARGRDRNAGIVLANELRKISPTQKIAIYCGNTSAKFYEGREKENSIDLVTPSPVRLMQFLKQSEGDGGGA